AYLRALRFFAGFEGDDARAWLLAIVRNACFDWLARNRRGDVSDQDIDIDALEVEQSNRDDPAAQAVAQADARLLQQAIEALLDEVVADHVRSLQVDHLTDVASSDQHTVKPWFNGKLDFAPPVEDHADAGYPLVGGRVDYVGGHTVAALVYQRRQHPINVFVWPHPGGDAELRVAENRGYNAVSWRHSTMAFWVVSDLSAGELREFAQLVRK